MGFSEVKQSGKTGSDVFSFSVLCLHALLQNLPISGNAMTEVRSEEAIFYTEEQRRSEYINALQAEEIHFLPIISKCLACSASNRPSMVELCDRLNQLQLKIGIGKQGKSVLNGGTVVDISNQLQHISQSVDTTKSELEAYRIQLRSLLRQAESTVVPASNTHSMPHMAKKQMFDIPHFSAVPQHRSLPAHYCHGGRRPTSVSPGLETCKEVNCPIEVCSYVRMWAYGCSHIDFMLHCIRIYLAILQISDALINV